MRSTTHSSLKNRFPRRKPVEQQDGSQEDRGCPPPMQGCLPRPMKTIQRVSGSSPANASPRESGPAIFWGEEACRALLLLNVGLGDVENALDQAMHCMELRLRESEAEDPRPGFY